MKSLKRVVAICPFVLFFALLWIRQAPLASAAAAPYTLVTIQASQGSWGNNLADLDGDGFLDIIEGGGDLGGNVYWFQYPSWQRFQIGADGGGDDVQVADINRDGAPDVVVNGTGKIVWYENPRGTGGNVLGLWTKHTVDATLQSHDIELVDLDGDGRIDIVIRVEESSTYYYLQGATADTWTRVLIPQAPDGHGGLAAGDINRDGRIDLAENGFWLEAPANLVSGTWIKHDIAAWTAGSSAALYDINHDGRLDLFLAASESGPGPLAWFEAPIDPIAGVWIRHDIDAVEDLHRFFLVDMNKDGTEDLVFAEMHQTTTKRVGVYYNGGLGASWTLQVLSTQGSHNIAVGDIGNDGDNDIIGANWSTGAPDGGAQNMWRNDLNNAVSLDTWTYSQVDGTKPDVAFGLTFGDLDGDGRKDIISGEYWYRNPGGNLTGPWTRTTIGATYDAMLVMDVDGNGRLDVIAQSPAGSNIGIYCLTPNASATAFNSVLVGNIPASRDGNSQGYAISQLTVGSRPQLIFSDDTGFYAFTIPANPLNGNWPQVHVDTTGTQEGVAPSDIDRDGKIDLVGSSHTSAGAQGKEVDWWKNPGTGLGNWSKVVIGPTTYEADRVAVADINKDGRPDVVVTDSDYNTATGNLSWFEQTAAAGWIKHPIATNVGSLASMDVGDFNKDGLTDIVVGEHQNDHGPLLVTVFQNVGGGTSWTPHVISSGRESHEGTQVVDLDNDGDLDVVSIAYNTHQFVHLWRNDAITDSVVDATPPQITLVTSSLVSAMSAQVTWTTNEPADSKVEYGPDSNYGTAVTLIPLATGHTVPLTGLTPNTQYHYRVTSKDASANSATSSDFTFTTLNQDTTPPQITNATVNPLLPTSATINWTTNEPADGLVEYGASSTYGLSTPLQTALVTVHSITIGGLVSNNTYHFRINTKDSSGNLAQSLDGVFTTPIPDTTLPTVSITAPTGGTVVGTITVTASASDNVGVVGVQFFVDGIALGAETTGPFSTPWNTVLVANGTHALTAVARDAAGNSKTSNPVNVTVSNVILVTHRQGVGVTNDSSSSTISLAFASPTLAGDFIVAAISMGNNVSVTCSDNQSNAYTSLPVQFDGTNNQGLAICYAPNVKAGATTVTVTLGSIASYRRLLIHEYSGLAKTNPVDVTVGTIANGTTAANNITTTAGVTTANGALIFAAVMDDVGTTNIQAGTNFTLRGSVGGADLATEDRLQPAAGSIAGTFTFANAHRYLARMVAFKPEAAVDTTLPTVSVTAPAGGATVSSNVPLTATATDNVGVVGLQYKVDGANIGSELTSGNYNLTWDSTTVTNGTRVLTAVARDAAGNSKTSAGVSVTVNNVDATPPTFQNVLATAITRTGATITWTTNEPATAQVQHGTGTNYGSLTTLDNTTTLSHSQALTGLTPGTTYFFRVLSSDAAGNPGTSAGSSFTTAPPDTTPPTISAVNATGIDKTSATMTWTTNEAASTQVVYGTDTNYGSSTTLIPALTTGHSQALSGLTAGTTYFYRVLSSDADNNPANADASFTTAPPDTTPPTISGLNATLITRTGATIEWTTNEAATTQVLYGTDTNYGLSTTLIPALTTGHSQALSGLTAGTTYFYRVLSSDADNNPATADASFTTAPPDTTPPNISVVNATGIDKTSATITWTTNEAATTQVLYGTDTNYGLSTTLIPALTTGHSQPLSGLIPGTTYFYCVVSSDADNNPASADASFTTTPPDTTPPTISAVNATGIDKTSATIAWTTNEAASTQVLYGTDTNYGSSTTLIPALTTGHSQALSGLTPGTTYFYRVLSSDADNNPASADASFTTTPPDTTPPTISAVNATGIDKTSATITWTTDEAATTQVLYGTDTNYGLSTTLIPTLTTAHSQALSGLTAGTTYFYRVLSSDADNNPASADASFTTTPPDTTPPNISSVSASGIGLTSATIAWTTDEAATTQVLYGTDTNYGLSTTLSPELTTGHSQPLSGLTPGTTYFYRVLSSDADNNPASADASFTTTPPDTTPPNISGVSASGITMTSATITWTTNEAATTQVQYGTDTNYGLSTTLNPSLTTGHSQPLSGLTPGATYFYRVLSSDADDNLASAESSFTTVPPDTTPPNISGVSASGITMTSATITWITNEASTTQVLYGLDTNYAFSTTLNPSLTTSHTQPLSGLAAGATYFFRVLSADAAGNPAGVDSFFTTVAPDLTPPVLSSVTVTGITSSTATVTWTTNEPGTTQVRYGLTSGYGSSTALDPVYLLSHTRTLTNLQAGTTYHYQALSTDAFANPGSSGDLTFTTLAGEVGVPTLGLLSRWKLNETSGTAAGDSAGASTGTLGNFACTTLNCNATSGWTAPGQFAGALNFDGADDIATVLQNATLNDLGSFSYSAWVFPRSLGEGSAGRIIDKSGTGYKRFRLNNATVSSFYGEVRLGTTSAVATSPSNSVSLNQWQHVVMTFDNTTKVLRIYKNGVQVASGTGVGNPQSDATGNFLIGNNAAGSATFNGLIDDVIVYNRTLTPAEVLTLASAAPDLAAPLISGVNASGVTMTAASIVWNTDEVADSRVEYGPTTDYGTSTTLNPAIVLAHSVPVSGLTPGTVYHVRVTSRDTSGNTAQSDDFAFTTLPPDTTPPLVSSVLVTGLTASTATITWQTNETATSQVSYGLTSTYGSFTALDPAFLASHSRTLTNLQFGTTYHYQALSTDVFGNTGSSGDLTFTTLTGESGVPATGLLSRWKLNDSSGTTAADSAGASTATLGNFACTTLNCNATSGWTNPGRFAGALNFDGSNDVATVLANATLNDLGSFTYSAWVFPRSLGESSVGRILDKTGTGYKRFRLNNATVSSFYGEVRLGTTNAVATGPANSVTLNQWQHVVMTFDNTTKILRIYKNGVQIATGTGAGNPQSDATGNLLVGNNANGTATFNGLIDDVMVYNRALSPSEILTLASGAPDLAAPLISGVNTSGLLATAATIVWNTDEVADSQVEYGTTTDYGTTTPINPALVQSHGVPLSGLTASTVYHVRVTSRDTSGNIAQSDDFAFTTGTPPTVSLVTPSAGIVSGFVNVTATADDDVGVASVQYFLDGTTAVSGLLTGSPYTFAWSTANFTNGTHTLTAVAKDVTGNSTTGAGVSVTVSNVVPPIGFVQSASSNNTSTASTIVQALTSPVTAGNLIVAAVSWSTNGTFTCSDSQGNVYAMLAAQFDSTNSQSLGICYAANAKPGATTVTATFGSSSTARRILVHEYQGIAKTSPLDVTAGRTANGTTAANNISSGSVTTTAAGDLVFVAVIDTTGTTNITAGTGYTLRATTSSNLASEDRVLPAAGAVTGTFTFGTAHRYVIRIVAFKAGS